MGGGAPPIACLTGRDSPCAVPALGTSPPVGGMKKGQAMHNVNMSTGVLSIRLDGELKERLDALSASTGRSASYYVREAISEHLAALEYAYTLRAEAEAARRGEIPTRTLDEVAAELGLDG